MPSPQVASKMYPSPFNLLISFIMNAISYIISMTTIYLNALYASYEAVAHVFYYPFLSPIDPKDKAVFVTGCDSGFGFKLAQDLDAMGYTVFAGCLKIDEERTRNLQDNASNRLQIVKCDVSSDKDVNSAVELVRSNLNGKRLWALVSNAGVTSAHWVDWGRPGVAHYEKALNVNVLGSVRLTKAFLPLLRACRGSRVVLVSSILANVELLTSVSNALTNAALSSFGHSLRRELKHWDIHVSIIEPAGFRTEMNNPTKMKEELLRKWEETPEEIKGAYSSELRTESTEAVAMIAELANRDIRPAVEAMVEAVTCPQKPAAIYTPGNFGEHFFLQFMYSANAFFTDHLLSLAVVLPSLKYITGLKKQYIGLD